MNAQCRMTLRLDEHASKDALTALKLIKTQASDRATRRGPTG
jgi:hypothetical protein